MCLLLIFNWYLFWKKSTGKIGPTWSLKIYWVYMIYLNKVIYTFKWVLYQTNIIKCLSYYWFYQKHCPHIFLLNIKRAYLLCNWSGNTFKESKKLRQYIRFESTIVFWSNQIQKSNSSHIIMIYVCVYVLPDTGPGSMPELWGGGVPSSDGCLVTHTHTHISL